MKNFKKGFFTALKIIAIVIVAFIVLIAGIIMFKANMYPDKVPDIFGYKPMIVLSGSMETSINKGDLVFVKMTDTDKLKVDDVIAFRNEDDKVTTHRIVEIVRQDGDKLFRTKGDANNTEDANLVKEKDVEGVYVGRIPGLGNVLIFIQQPISLAVIVLTILVIGLVWLYLINKKENKDNKFKDENEKKEFEEFKKQKALEQKKKEEEQK